MCCVTIAVVPDQQKIAKHFQGKQMSERCLGMISELDGKQCPCKKDCPDFAGLTRGEWVQVMNTSLSKQGPMIIMIQKIFYQTFLPKVRTALDELTGKEVQKRYFEMNLLNVMFHPAARFHFFALSTLHPNEAQRCQHEPDSEFLMALLPDSHYCCCYS